MAGVQHKMTEHADMIDLGETLGDLVGELRAASDACTSLQWSISTLLEKVSHPDLAAEIHMLQDIDRLQQTLADLAAIVSVSAPVARDTLIERDVVNAAIRLESLRQRLGLSNGGVELVGASAAAVDPDDIDWF